MMEAEFEDFDIVFLIIQHCWLTILVTFKINDFVLYGESKELICYHCSPMSSSSKRFT